MSVFEFENVGVHLEDQDVVGDLQLGFELAAVAVFEAHAAVGLPSSSSSISEAISNSVSFRVLNAANELSKTFCLRVDLRMIVSSIPGSQRVVSIGLYVGFYLIRIWRPCSSSSPGLSLLRLFDRPRADGVGLADR